MVVNMMQYFLAIFFLLAFRSETEAYPKEYGPFTPEESPTIVPLTKCSNVKGMDTTAYEKSFPKMQFFVTKKETATRIVGIEPLTRTGGWRIAIFDGNGLRISQLMINDVVGGIAYVKSADLNQDGKPDFIVEFCLFGCGLAAEGSTHLFLLSYGRTYTALNYYSYHFGAEDIVRFRRAGPCYFIHNDLIGNGEEKTRDGHNHNFWVYRLYRFKGSQMVMANADDPRFPKWIWYTFKENHKKTDQLTNDQKKRIIEKR